MGALHDGHMSLIHRSLQDNDLTVLSIFVNPSQFAPHEDLSAYPRTLETDLALLSATSFTATNSPTPKTRTPSAVFLPSVEDMYPSGIVQDVENQKGTFVEVKGYGHQMEGKSRPTFFRGVATVITKLFNSIQPTNAYFGQKDIQQALIMRRMVRDLLFANPGPENVHIVPTYRSEDGLALSSRNAYLSPSERAFAPTLYNALKEAQEAWETGCACSECLQRAADVVESAREESAIQGVSIQMDYIEMNDPETFEVLLDDATIRSAGRSVILSGAVWVGKTRLIDNFLLGELGVVLK